MGIFFKKKIGIEECADSIVYFISEIQRKINNEFSEALYANFIGDNENIDAPEKTRRDWEISYYILSLIFIWIEGNFDEKDGLPIMESILIRLGETCSGIKYKEMVDSDPQDFIDFRDIAIERVNLYKSALRYDGSGTDIKHLSECLLSVIWFDLPEANNPLMAGLGLYEGIYIAEVSLKIIEIIKGFFDKYKIR
jgi:hypothetical protein